MWCRSAIYPTIQNSKYSELQLRINYIQLYNAGGTTLWYYTRRAITWWYICRRTTGLPISLSFYSPFVSLSVVNSGRGRERKRGRKREVERKGECLWRSSVMNYEYATSWWTAKITTELGGREREGEWERCVREREMERVCVSWDE